ATSEQARSGQNAMGDAVWSAAETLRETTEWMLDAETADRLAGASDYLAGFARVLGGWFHLKATLEDPECAALARLYANRVLPFAETHCALARSGGADLAGITSDDLA
ncbi:MAG: acyl-CoA dehydrogenase C-terminal domain-containing protein, partial [Pseudomonadota bacterium]